MAGFRKLLGADEIVWNGRAYRRQPDHPERHRSAYFMATTAPRSYLHRDIFEANFGPIPKGWHVHHVDHDPLNNEPSNLASMSPADHATYHDENRAELPKTCDGCGQGFAAMRPWARWCSPACKEKVRRRLGLTTKRERKPFLETRACDDCGATYQARRPWARFCTSACKQRAARRAA